MIELQPFTEADAPTLIGWINSPEFMMQWAGSAFSYPLDATQLEPLLRAAAANGGLVARTRRERSMLVDLSHEVEHGTVTYPGLPGPIICDYLSRFDSRQHYAEGTEFQIGKIEMVGNTGTYLDSPFHRDAHGKDLSELPLSSVAHLEGIVIRATAAGRAIDRSVLAGADVGGKAVLVQTGWDRHWGTSDYFQGHPFLTRDAAEDLVARGAALVGLDSLNIDDTDDGARPVHSLLLGAAIPIVEHLCNLQALPDRGFRFYAVPVKVKGFGTFPVRAFAVID